MSLSRLFLLSFSAYSSLFGKTFSRDSFRFWVGILGNVTSAGFYFSSWSTINNIWIKRTVEDSEPYSYLAAMMNCMICFVYGLPVVHPNNNPLLVINGGGFLLEVFYIAIFYKFSPRDLRLKIFGILALELAFVLCALASALGVAYTPGDKKRIDVLGLFCIISGILMYGSPVIIIQPEKKRSILGGCVVFIKLVKRLIMIWHTIEKQTMHKDDRKEVFQTKNVEHMPWHTSLIGIFNAICWTTYSLLRFDLYILIPNAMGVIFSAVQLIVFLCFKCCRMSTTPRDLESPEGTIIHLDEKIPNAPVSCFVRLRSWLIRTI